MIKNDLENIQLANQNNCSSFDLKSLSNYKYYLTFDVDWAPDFCVSNILDKLKNANIKATFFVTHASDIIADIINQGHNVGLHPNFLPNSSQGKCLVEIMDYLFKISPNSTILRTHCLIQSTPLLYDIFNKYQQLKFDFSLLMYKFPLVKAFEWNYDGSNLIRINYNWEDDFAFYDTDFIWERPKFYSDITVFDFHPIHVALNSRDNKKYNLLKREIFGKPLWKATENQLKKFESNEKGTRDFLDAIIESDATPIEFSELL